jgi:glycerate kinase
MKIIIAPDSFKGTLSAARVCEIISAVLKKSSPNAEITSLPLADGGEGTVDCLRDALHGIPIRATVSGPLNNSEVTAEYCIFRDDSAVMEMSAASGFHLVPAASRDIMHSNTFGTGQMFLDAVERGCRRIYMGIGGSATNDGGIGFAAALGVRFLDGSGRQLAPLPTELGRIDRIDTSGVSDKLKDVRVTVMSDVTNPLTGPQGCARVFGPQKGAGSEAIWRLEAGMRRYAEVVERSTGRDLSRMAGAGAAGGLGFGLLTFVDADIRSGIDTILDILDFNELIAGADLVITGEGRMDAQSAFGKVAGGVAAACKRSGIPCTAIVGDVGEDYEKMYPLGIDRIFTARKNSMTSREAMENAAALLENAAAELAATL